jgi:hypothetical protein
MLIASPMLDYSPGAVPKRAANCLSGYMILSGALRN